MRVKLRRSDGLESRRLLQALGSDVVSGYALTTRLHSDRNGQEEACVAGSAAGLYPALYRLEGGGRIASSWRAIDSGDLRRVYRASAHERA